MIYNSFITLTPHAAQADAAGVVKTLASSVGKAATTSQQKNAQRTVERAFKKRRLTPLLGIQTLEHHVVEGLDDKISTFHVRPEDWLSFLLATDPALLAGPGVRDPRPVFEAFWETLRLSNPQHCVFATHGHELGQVVPLMLHGDEGRSIKKTAYLIVSMQSPIGSVAREFKGCPCREFLRSRPDLPNFGPGNQQLLRPEVPELARVMYTNYPGHSFGSRYLLFGLGGWVYKKNRHVVHKLFEVIVESFERMFTEGIIVNGSRFFAGVVGCKGDMDFFAKYFNLERSYSNVMSRSLGFICHECMATAGSQSQVCFEDFSEDPAWATTLYRARPWSRKPVLVDLPCNFSAPEQMLKSDPFHVVKLGIARDLIGGIIVTLARKGFWDHPGFSRDFVRRLERAHSMFVLFCRASKLRPSLRGFTKQFFHVKNFLSSPWCNSKGSDSMILLKFLAWFLALNVNQPRVAGFESLLGCMLQTTHAMLTMFRIIHSHRLFLERSCAARLYVQMMRALRGFRVLSKKCYEMNMRGFVLKPKAHALHHVAYQLKQQLQSGSPLILNPEALSCEVDEDFIGRCSRLSRRVNVKLCDRRVIQRMFLKARALFRRRGSL